MVKLIAELTTFGWTVMLYGKENILTNLYLSQPSAAANLTIRYTADSKIN